MTTLRDELLTGPRAVGYAGITDTEAAAAINLANLSRIRASMSGDELFAQTDTTEFAGLTDAKQQLWVSFCTRESIDPRSAANVSFVQFIFGAGATVGAFALARVETVSIAEINNFGTVTPGGIQRARAV